jgi:hypothetical protein
MPKKEGLMEKGSSEGRKGVITEMLGKDKRIHVWLAWREVARANRLNCVSATKDYG